MTKPLSLPRSKRTVHRRRPLHRASARRLITELNALNEIGKAISSQLNLQAVLETIYQQTSRLMDTRNFYIALYHVDHDLIEFPLAVSNSERQDWPPRRWSTGFTEWLIRNKRPLRRNTNSYEPGVDPIRFGTMTLSYLGVPIILGEQVLGVLSVQSVDRYDAYSERDEQILLMIADQAAIAIANAQRYAAVDHELQQRLSQLEALETTTRELNQTLHLSSILHRLVERVMSITGADAGGVGLIDEQRQVVLPQAVIGYGPDIEPFMKQGFSLTEGVVGEVARTRQPLLTRDVRLSSYYQPLRSSTCSQMTIPLIHTDILLGIIVLESNTRSHFTQDMMQFVQQVADHAALSLYNARIHEQALRQQQQLEQQSRQLQDVLRISQALSANLNLDDLLPEVVRAIRSSLGFNIALLSLVDHHDPMMMRRRAVVGIPPEQWEILQHQLVPVAWYYNAMRDQFQISRSYFIPHNHAEYSAVWHSSVQSSYIPDLGERKEGEWHPNDALFVPLYDTDGHLISIISVDDPQDRRIPDLATIQVLEIFANQAAIAIENARMYSQTHERAITDGLTGLYNQAYFASLLEREVQTAHRYHQDLSLLVLDLDHFKGYNDSYGHLEGNVLLREFAQLMRSQVRDADVVARNGGEEFAVLLPQTDAEGALQLAERLRKAVADYTFRHRRVTVSIGVATLQPLMNAVTLHRLADEALYRAKGNGRNSVCC